MLALQDTDRLHGAAVRTADDAVVGHVCAVLTDGVGVALLLGVGSRLLDLREVLVPACAADLVGREVRVAATRQQVAAAPRLADSGDLSDEDLAALERHWGASALRVAPDVLDAA
ncbi:hypothetical protein [Amnibacterium endophyticum]|uniref:PRC-barrel domain-containing protein n=1 Tax=Amnibacterium endophyticum TaxID=2109337 RepID=A0ABW4LFH9_9MICO